MRILASRNFFQFLVLILCFLTLLSCHLKNTPTEQESKTLKSDLSSESAKEIPPYLPTVLPLELPEYRIGVGDTIEVLYHVSYTPIKDYILEIQDLLSLEFTYHDFLNREVVIRPDGKITLLDIGDIGAAGLTCEQLRENVKKAYSTELQDPEVTVTLKEYNRVVNQFREDLRTSTRGPSKLLNVRPDGMISLPIIGEIAASGLTIPELDQKITKEYKEISKNLDVSVMMEKISSNQIFVLGEVNKPGSFTLTSPLTITQALAQAGGYNENANLSSIIIVRQSESDKTQNLRVNLSKVLKAGNYNQDLVLQGQDLVYVPKTFIAKVDQFVDQYLIKALMSRGWGIYLGYDLNKQNQ